MPIHAQGSRYILFVTDGDEVVAPQLLRSIREDPSGAYNALNAPGHGYKYLEMMLLVYGFRYKQEEPWRLGFMATDRVTRGLGRMHGHLASLTAIRFQVGWFAFVSVLLLLLLLLLGFVL